MTRERERERGVPCGPVQGCMHRADSLKPGERWTKRQVRREKLDE